MRVLLTTAFLWMLSTLMLAENTVAEQEEKEAKQTETISLGDGTVQMSVPIGWQKERPRSRILAYEFSIPSGEDGVNGGRFTVSTMGGSVKANVDRWMKQFPEKTKSKIEEKKIGEQTVHMVDLSGTFLDSRGPAFPAVKRDDYRLLAAIIPTEESGQHFLKFYGPSKVVEEHAKSFAQMIESVRTDKATALKAK